MKTEPDKTLFEAIKINDIERFRAILKEAPCVISGTTAVPLGYPNQETPLAYACELARVEMVISLLQNASDCDMRYAFPFALKHTGGNLEIVKEFITLGMDVNMVWRAGQRESFTTPLLCAIRHNNLELVQYLIGVGADVNPADPEGEVFILNTALETFSDNGPSIIKYILQNGADPNENYQETLFTIFDRSILDYKWDEIFDLCLDFGGKLTTYPYMYFACKSGNVDIVKYLIARGLSAVNEVRYNGHIALHVTGCDGKRDSSMVELLLKWGSDPNSQVTPIGDDLYDTFLVGFSALHYACSQGDLEKLELLLDYGADVHSVNCSDVGVLFQLLDAVCKDKALYEYMVFSSDCFSDDSFKTTIEESKSKAETRLNRYTKMTELLLASGAKLLGDEWMICYTKPFVVMSVDVLSESSIFLSRTRSLIEYAKSRLKQPKSLTDVCRINIRSVLPVSKSTNIAKLADILPKPLLSLLLFEDIL